MRARISLAISPADDISPRTPRKPRAYHPCGVTPAPGIQGSCDASERLLQLIVASRRAAESAMAIAMITSAIPGIEVHELEQEIIVLPPMD